jgi:glycosyltransferase involved in cell wall biosynthesis
MKKNPKTLNIALICDSIDNITGGMFMSVNRFAFELKKKGHNIIIITTTNKFSNNETDRFKDFPVYRFFSSMPLGPEKFRFMLIKQSSLEKILKEHKIDVIYSIMPILSGYVALKAAKKLDIPTVMHLHMQIENFGGMGEFLNAIKFMVAKYISYFFQRSEMVITPSDFAKNILLENHVKGNIVTISNGVNTSEFRKIPYDEYKYVYKKYNIDENKFLIVGISRLSPEKSVDTSIKAMPYILKENPNTQLILISGGPLMGNFKRMVKKLGVENSVIFAGRIPEEDKVPLLNASNLFLHPSITDLEGIVILEAMGCGLPILVSDSTNSAASTLIKENGVTFRAKDHVDLATKANKLIRNNKMLEKMAELSLEVVKDFDINKSISKLEDVFEKSIAMKKNK